MKSLIFVLVFTSVISTGYGFIRKPQPKAQTCGPDTLLIYQDCKICVCPRPNRPATCYRKSCDLRTKDGGMCPPTTLKLDDQNLCEEKVNLVGACKVDSDCPGPQFCCFDFCHGSRCVNPIPLEAPLKIHPGRGYQ